MNAERSGRLGIISGRKKNFSSLLDKEFTKRRVLPPLPHSLPLFMGHI